MSKARQEWVEIIEPSSREKMYTNPSTGEIVFTPPEGAIVKPMSSNQWWELYDAGSNRHYYYNAVTSETVWNKPGNGADIISLTKLQQNSEQETQEEEVPAQNETSTKDPPLNSSSSIDELTDANGATAAHKAESDEDQVFNHGTSSSPHAGKSSPKRKLSDMLAHEIEPMSPLKLDFPNERFSISANYPTAEEPSAHTQATSQPNSRGVELRDKTGKTVMAGGGKSQVNYQEHERGSWINIKLVKEGRVSTDTIPEEGRGGAGMKLDGRQISSSLDRTKRGRDGLGGSGKFEKSQTLELRGGSRRGKEPVRPAPSIPPIKASPDSKTKPRSSTLTQQGNLASASSSSTHSTASSSSNTPPTPQTSHGPSKLIASPEKVKNKARVQSSVAAPPIAPPFVQPQPARSKTVSGKPRARGRSLDKFELLSQHKVGLLFKKKVTIANMLSWTKDPIKQPMIQTRDKQVKKEAIDLFKLVQQYMGDKKTKYKDPNQLALVICQRCWEKKELRDEIYIQLCRQTTGNEKPSSIERGWELISICLAFFPPSIKFRSYLEGYLWRNVEHKPEHKSVRVEVYAQYGHKKIEKIAQSGAKRGSKKPTIEEVVHAKNTPFHPSMFGTSLEEVMELQKKIVPESQKLPWVVQALVKAVVELEGPSTEGIFRVPGDIDEVNSLKLEMDKGRLPMEMLRDPHVPASLLKLWFRELEDPLIPEEYYDECIRNCNDDLNAVSLVESLPDLNKEVLIYLVKFLKEFVTPENTSKTKMGLENIAMVWAPNFLRCPSDDHALIFENTRKEMAFLRILLKYLETEPEYVNV